MILNRLIKKLQDMQAEEEQGTEKYADIADLLNGFDPKLVIKIDKIIDDEIRHSHELQKIINTINSRAFV